MKKYDHVNATRLVSERAAEIAAAQGLEPGAWIPMSAGTPPAECGAHILVDRIVDGAPEEHWPAALECDNDGSWYIDLGDGFVNVPLEDCRAWKPIY